MIPTPYAHQAYTTKYILDQRNVFIMSDPGTGKTRSVLDAVATLKEELGEDFAPWLVVCPLSIMRSAWEADCAKFTPQLTLVTCPAAKRVSQFQIPADIYVINHDAVKWLVGPKSVVPITTFGGVVYDESTAFKNPTSQRSRAARALADCGLEYNLAMSGTPYIQSVQDLWGQMYLVDQGASLGKKFYAYRTAVAEPVNVNGFTKWVDRPEAVEAVLSVIADRTVRFKLEDCLEMPEQVFRQVVIDLGPDTKDKYDTMVKRALLEFDTNKVSAINGAAMVTKLLQIASGAVYSAAGSADSYVETADICAPDSRYNIIAELVEERKQTLVAFQWQHQKERLIQAFKARGIYDIGIIDGTTSSHASEVVDKFQAGDLRVILAHPQSAGHGHTLTAASAVIWASPTYRAELFVQFNRRVYRAGQRHKTEVIMLAGRSTVEPEIYRRLETLVDQQNEGLDLMSLFTTRTMTDEYNTG